MREGREAFSICAASVMLAARFKLTINRSLWLNFGGVPMR
jgi:hypothetical protein